MNTITSSLIGKLSQHEEFEDWWESAPVKIPYFDQQEVVITLTEYVPEEDPEFMAEADAALTAFLSKGLTDRATIAPLVYRNCMEFLHAIGYEEEDKELWDITDEQQIWQHVQLTEIYVSKRRYRQADVYVQLCCECDWEPEHGLQIILKKGRQVTRVSPQDGHLTEADAYDKPDEQDELLSQYRD